MNPLTAIVERLRLHMARRSHYMRITIKWNMATVVVMPVLETITGRGINLDREEIIFPTTKPISKAFTELKNAIIQAYPHRHSIISKLKISSDIIVLEPHMVTAEWLQATRLPYTYKIS